MSELETPDKVLSLLSAKYNIMKQLSFLSFDDDFEMLKSILLSVKKDSYCHNDRILIEHFDTDFYYSESSVGINLRNFFTVAEIVNIPVHLFVFYTNHFGIKNEIDIICKSIDPKYRPLVLESFISKCHYPDNPYTEISTHIDNITCPALCMMNGIRSHRHALYNHISHLDQTQLAINFTTVSS